MQPELLNEGAASVRFWRAVALGLSVLALGLSAHRLLLRQNANVAGVPATEHASRAAVKAPSLPSAPPTLTYEEVTQLATTRDEAVLDRLFAIAVQGQPGVSIAAYEGIGHWGGDRALRFLSQRLQSVGDREASDVANALALLGGSDAHALLQAAAHSRRTAVRDAAFAALVNVDTADVHEFMLLALNEPAPMAAINYFLNCRDPRALPALERLARSPVQELSGSALEALLVQGSSAEGAITRLLQTDTELMDALLANPPHTLAAVRAVRKAAIVRVHEGAVGSGPVFDFLARDLTSDSRDALLFAARDPASASAACDALARRGDSASLMGLSQLTHDRDPEVAGRASCALASDPDSRSRVPLERAMRGDQHGVAARALVYINAPGARAI